MRRKHALPPFSILPHIKVDLERLNSYLTQVESDFSNVIQSNQGLCGIHHELVEKVYENFEQISLTTLPPPLAAQGRQISQMECADIEEAVNGQAATSTAQKIRRRKELASEDSILNEHSYSFKTALLQGSYIEEIMKQFKAKPTRVRLVRLRANSTVPPHIDYDPSYAVRVIIPLKADDHSVNMFWVKNVLHTTVFKPGHAYFLNTGFRHAVVNFSNQDRVTLMMSLKGQEDLEGIGSVDGN